MLFREIVRYFDNHSKHTNTVCGQSETLDNVKSRWYMKQPLCFKELTEPPEVCLLKAHLCIKMVHNVHIIKLQFIKYVVF
jgi:hypothetical protein